MVAQDIAHDELAAHPFRAIDDAPGISNRSRQRLFDEDMGARLHCRAGIVCMAVGISGDDRKIRFCLCKTLLEASENRIGFKFRGQGDIGAVDESNDLRLRVMVMGERMAPPHVAEAGDQNPHFTAPDVMPRISCREKMT